MSVIRSANNYSEELYTSAEVRDKLGIAPSTLVALVDKGVVVRVVPPGRKNGYYTKESVDDYYEQQQLFIQTLHRKKSGLFVTRIATRADQMGIVELGRAVYGLSGTPRLETRLAWFDRNPNMDFIAVNGTQVVGHLSLMPLTPTAMQKMLRGEIRGWDITPDDIETYDEEKQYNLFVMSGAVSKSEEYFSMNAGLLIREAEKFLFEIAEQGRLIKSLYATSRTKDGIYLCERMEMELVPEYSNAHRKAFKLDMGGNKSSWVQSYRDYVRSLKLSSKQTKGIL
ncbi:MAG: hypothetical protein H0U76_28135 [Ktedonobacteraceae bacterium]|nr:hypothetical protein [Ktedonobacteraceae bacterium]